jgi:hypothetical protein
LNNLLEYSTTCSSLLVLVCAKVSYLVDEPATKHKVSLLALPVVEGHEFDDPVHEPLEALSLGPRPNKLT